MTMKDTKVLNETEHACLTLTVPKAAQLLGIGKNSAYELVRAGRLRSVKVGRRLVVPRREVEDFLEREMEMVS